MGKRNLALVGMHEDYFAEILDDNVDSDPSRITDCASPEDAATSYFKNIFENSNARVRTATVAVWAAAASRDHRHIFDAKADLTPCRKADASAGEYDILLTVTER